MPLKTPADSIRDTHPPLLTPEEQSDDDVSRAEAQTQDKWPRIDVKDGIEQDKRLQEQQPTENEPDGQRGQETGQTKRAYNDNTDEQKKNCQLVKG